MRAAVASAHSRRIIKEVGIALSSKRHGRTAPASTSTQSSRFLGRARRWNERLGQRPDLPYAALIVTVVVAALLFVVPLSFLIIDLIAAVTRDETLAYQGTSPDLESSEPIYRDRQSGDSAPTQVALPHIDWNDSRLRRRAAAVLLVNGHPNLAADLLRESDIDPAVLNALTTRDHAAALVALRQALQKESLALGNAWMTLSGTRGEIVSRVKPGLP